MSKHVLKNSGLWFIVILVGVLLALWWGLGFAEQARKENLEQEEIERILDERGEVIDETQEVEVSRGDTPLGYRGDVMFAIGEQFQALLPAAADADAISRFWFVSDDEVYVEYVAGEEISMAYLEVEGEQDSFVLQRRALYAQSLSGTWELLEGEEVLFTKPLRDLYERDSNGNWVSRN